MRFAISIPQYVRHGFDAAAFRAYMARAEELGFDGAWAQEQVLGSAGALSPLQAMTYAAACSERLRLGCAVFVSPLHSPIHLAKALASLDCLSHGRVDVGLGTGGRARPFAAFGIDPEGLVARFNEGVSLMKACWTEPRINFDGRFWRLDGAAMEPKPVQRPHPPIWIGGNQPAALKRAVRIGEGFFGAGSQSTAQFAEQVGTIRDELAQQGQGPEKFRIAKRVYIHVGDDSGHAREQIEHALEHHYGRAVPGVALAGPPADCVAGLRDVADAGAELILLNPLVEDAQQMERLAAEVMPALTDRV
jgi:probable F420-dependent oxidoreductase